MPHTTAPDSSASLRRGLGPGDAAAIVVSNVIGGGILFTPPQIADAIPNPLLFLAVWVAGGLLAFAGAMAYAELAALRPRAGGEYVYLREAYGPLAAFLTGWTSFVAGFSGAIAVSAVVLADYLGRFVPLAGDRTSIATLPLGPVSLTLSPQAAIAIAAIALMSLVHRRGLGPGRIFGNILASLKVLALLLFIAIGFAIGTGSTANFTSSAGAVSGASWLMALIPVMFSYSGWNAAAYVAEEIRDPGRNAPRALAIGTAAVVAIYLLLNLLYLYVFPVRQLAAVKISVLDAIADQLLGGAAGDVMAVVAIVSLAASISAMVLAGPRVYFAMARDGLFFASAGRVHPRFRSPSVSIAAQGVWSALLVLSGTAFQLVNYTGFAVLLFSGVAVAALFVLRRRLPNIERPFRALGYPVAPAVFALSSLLIVVNAIRESPGTSAAGLLVIGAGIPLYFLFRRKPNSSSAG